MSLSISLSAATSSLMALEKQMAVASNNIANASTAGYTTETVATSAIVTNGTGSGVSVSAASSTVDQYLLKDISQALSASASASTTASYYDTLQTTLGSLSSSSSSSSSTTTDSGDLSSEISSLDSDLSSLTTTPDSTSLKGQVVSDLEDVTATLRSMSSSIQSQRSQAESEIGDTVTDANSQLDTVSALNTEIAKAKASGQSAASLENERTTALQSLSSDLGISYFTDGNGNVQVYTSSGQTLLDGTDTVHSLSHTVSTSLSASTTYESGAIAGIYVNGADITDSVTSGTLGALIDQRDDVLPAAQDELDNLASTLSTTLNGISNQGTADPPPDSLTGSASVTGLDAVSVASGTTVRLVTTDSDGDTTGYEDVDLSGATSIDDIVTDLNGVSGVTASVVDGHLQLSVASGSGIAVSTLSGSIGGTDLSSYFGLNDVISGGSSAATISVGSSLLSSSGNLPSSSLESTQTVGSAAAASASATIATEMEAALSGSQSFGAAGALGAVKTSISGYAADIVSGIASKYTSATSKATTAETTLSTLQSQFSDETGVNTDDETAKLTQYENAYAASAEIISVVSSMFNSLLTAVQS